LQSSLNFFDVSGSKLGGSTEPPEPPLDPPQILVLLFGVRPEVTAILFETMGFLSFLGAPDTDDTVAFRENFVRGARRSNSHSSAC